MRESFEESMIARFAQEDSSIDQNHLNSLWKDVSEAAIKIERLKETIENALFYSIIIGIPMLVYFLAKLLDSDIVELNEMIG